MTAQMTDEFRYNGAVYALVGINPASEETTLYYPQDFGMETFSNCTACWRGYVMYYDIVDDELLLTKMLVNTHEPVTVNGVKPTDGSESYFKYSYDDIGLKTKFTGTILLAKDFIQEMYVHMGFQRPMAFRTVLEFDIEDGSVIEIEDLSTKMARSREKDPGAGARPGSPDEESVKSWISDTFSLRYDKEE